MLYFCVFRGIDPPASFKWSGNDHGAVGSLTAVCGSHGLGGLEDPGAWVKWPNERIGAMLG